MSNLTPKVSVGMPVYNGAETLPAALDSLLAQTYTDFEVLINDNASTDATEAICRAYAARDSRIRYERNSANLGAAGNFNRVFERARGAYFKWFACDDLLAPDYLAECVAALEHLQASASAELARREGLETAVFEAQTSLAQVRAALVGSRQAIPRATG